MASLQSHGHLSNVFDFILQNIPQIQKDFEIKRVIIGLSTLTLSPGSCNLDQGIQQRFPAFLEAIVSLSEKSLLIR